MDARCKYEAVRDSLGMTDYEVAKKAGIEKSTFYTWRKRSEENGYLTMGMVNMMKMAKALGVRLEDLVGDAN